jgi:hypothetical protein
MTKYLGAQSGCLRACRAKISAEVPEELDSTPANCQRTVISLLAEFLKEASSLFVG